MQWIMTYRSRDMICASNWNAQSVLVTMINIPRSESSQSIGSPICLLFTISVRMARPWMPITTKTQNWNCTANTTIAKTRGPITNKCHRSSITSPGILVFLPLSRRLKRRWETIAQAIDKREVATDGIWISPETIKPKSEISEFNFNVP